MSKKTSALPLRTLHGRGFWDQRQWSAERVNRYLLTDVYDGTRSVRPMMPCFNDLLSFSIVSRTLVADTEANWSFTCCNLPMLSCSASTFFCICTSALPICLTEQWRGAHGDSFPSKAEELCVMANSVWVDRCVCSSLISSVILLAGLSGWSGGGVKARLHWPAASWSSRWPVRDFARSESDPLSGKVVGLIIGDT